MFYHLKIILLEQDTPDISSKSRNKKLQCYDWWNFFFDQPVIIDKRICDNIQKIAIGQEDYYTTDCLLDYLYSKEYCKMIAIILGD